MASYKVTYFSVSWGWCRALFVWFFFPSVDSTDLIWCSAFTLSCFHLTGRCHGQSLGEQCSWHVGWELFSKKQPANTTCHTQGALHVGNTAYNFLPVPLKCCVHGTLSASPFAAWWPLLTLGQNWWDIWGWASGTAVKLHAHTARAKRKHTQNLGGESASLPSW